MCKPARVLAPCPFCGDDMAYFDSDQYWIVWVYCLTCGGRTGRKSSKEAARDAWNRRAETADDGSG